MGDEDEVSNLPEHAWSNWGDVDGPFDPANDWLRTAPEDEQRIAVIAWFRARYRLPTHDAQSNLLGHDSRHVPYTMIMERFGSLVADELLEEAASELTATYGQDWEENPHNFPEQYDERFDLDVDEPTEPMYRLQSRIDEIDMILERQAEPHIKVVVSKLVYGSLIGILEAFLWETAEYWILSRKDALRACIENLPALRDKPIKLGAVFAEHAAVEQTVRAHLQRVVWHRWEDVGAIYKSGMGVSLPSFRPFADALLLRHHIVHRNGVDHQGQPVVITEESVSTLRDSVLRFARAATDACEDKLFPLAKAESTAQR